MAFVINSQFNLFFIKGNNNMNVDGWDPFLYNNVAIVSGSQLFLERLRIDARMEKAVQSPIVIITAGAGYGKSQAVYSFVRKHNVRTTWVQFSEGDNTGDRFWEKFVGAVSVINKESAARLVEVGFPATERQFNRYMAIPQADIIPGEKYIFVYDDVHLIRDAAVLGFLERSITIPFPNITSIMIARNEPRLNFSKFEARGQVARITEADLCFSREETLEYFHLMGLRPSTQTVTDICHDTEGWVFAVHLAVRSLKHSKTGDSYIPQSLRSNIFKLIESEVFSGLSDKMKKFLVKLSLIEQAVPDLLREITGSPEDYSLIDEMEQICSFIQYDIYLNAYRIHNLLFDYLRGLQSRLSDDEKREVWRKAAAWCRRNNRQISAINYYQKAGDYSGMMDAMYAFPLTLPKDTALRFLAALENIPPEFSKESTITIDLRFRLLINLEEFDRVETELKEIIGRLEGRKHPGKDEMQMLAACYIQLGFWGGITCIHTHDYSFTRYCERGHYYAKLSEYKPPIPLVMNLSSYVCRAADPGEMDRYNEALREAAPHMAAAINGCTWGMADLACAELAFFRGELIRAEQLAGVALDKARENDQYEIGLCSLSYLLRINLCRGNMSAIPALLDQIDACLEQPYFINRGIYHDLVTGMFYLQTGRPQKIAAWLKSDFEESDFNSLVHGLEMLVKAKYHLAEKRYPAVLVDIESRGSKYGPGAFILGRLEAKVLEAVCRYRMDDTAGALRDMEAAWELAKDNGLYMPFTELGKDMRALAGAALKAPSVKIPKTELEKIQRIAAAYAKNIFAVSKYFRAASPESAKRSKSGAALSPRELDVLTGLSQGLTREEIARVSSISANTVKSAVRSIFNKLGAVNRADAVRIATEQGIL
jgi:LuxR family maltose regulon positive regulatory protein